MRTRLFIYLLIFLGLATYFTTLFNGFLGDDYLQIVNNTSIHSVTNIPSFFTGSTFTSGGGLNDKGLYYRPIMQAVFAVIYSMAGAKPFFFHLFQILLHTTNGVLLFLLLKRFFKSEVSFFIAAIFLVHPIQSEAVNYIANLQEPLFFCFGILALLAIGKLNKQTIHNTYYIILATILLLLSFLSKETGILFLFLSIIYCYLFAKKYIWRVISYSLLVISIYSLLRFFVANIQSAQTGIAHITTASLLERLLHIPAIIFYYLSTFFVPIYPTSNQYWFIKTLTLTNFYLPIIILLLVFIIFYNLLRLSHYALSPKPYTLYFFITWFILGLSLHLQLIPLDATVADRWFYFPIVGLLCLLAVILNGLSLDKRRGKLSLISLIILITLLSLKTSTRNTNWKDGNTLYSHDIHTTPKNFILDNGYGTELIIKGECQKAKPYILSSISDKPYYANLNNMAIIYASEKNIPEAKNYLEKAVSVSTNNIVYENYANFLLNYGYSKEAELFSTNGLKQFPKNGKLHLIRAKALYLQKNREEALKSAKRAIEFKEPTAETVYSLILQNLPLTLLSPNK